MNPYFSTHVLRAVLSAAIGALAACGGGGDTGGGGGEQPPPQTVVFTRNNAGQYSLVSVSENGGSERVLANAGSFLQFHGFIAGHVIFSGRTSGLGSLYSVRLEGGAITPLTGSNFNHQFHAISSGGHVIFTRVNGTQSDLYSVKPDGSDFKALAAEADSHENFVAVAPGGRVIYRKRSLLAGAPSDIWSVSDDGSNPLQLTNTIYDDVPLFGGPTPDQWLVSRGFDPALARYVVTSTKIDGTRAANLMVGTDVAAVQGQTRDGRVILRRLDVTGSQFDLFTVRADGSGMVALSDSPDPESFCLVTPSGRVIFTRDKPGQPKELFSVNADGSNLRPLGALPANGVVQGATPNGYVIVSGPGQTGISSVLFTVPEDGRTPMIQVATNAEFFEGLFGGGSTRDGRVVFLRTANSGRLDVYSVKADGSEGSVLLAGSEDNDILTGITHQDRVIFERTTNSGAHTDLFSIRADGTGLVPLADTLADESFGGIF